MTAPRAPAMSEDFPEIYLEPDPDPCGDRQWCQHDFWSDDPEYGGLAATKYIRADLVDAKDAEILRLRAELAALREPTGDLVGAARTAINAACGEDGFACSDAIARAVLDAVLPRVRAENEVERADTLAAAIGYACDQGFEGMSWLEAWREGDEEALADLDEWRAAQRRMTPPPDAAP